MLLSFYSKEKGGGKEGGSLLSKNKSLAIKAKRRLGGPPSWTSVLQFPSLAFHLQLIASFILSERILSVKKQTAFKIIASKQKLEERAQHQEEDEVAFMNLLGPSSLSF